MSYSDTTSETIAARGEEIYQQQIRDKVDPKHKGKFLVLDLETGDYEIDAEDLVATDRLLAKHPNAIIYGVRVGFPAAYGIGFNFKAYTQ
ncbi:MAG: hypothetical protein OXN27_00925 [Candidatus Poribacteria bacterium]|nr:hypothetical protein [Candidatus Poribacteria bacterium]